MSESAKAAAPPRQGAAARRHAFLAFAAFGGDIVVVIAVKASGSRADGEAAERRARADEDPLAQMRRRPRSRIEPVVECHPTSTPEKLSDGNASSSVLKRRSTSAGGTNTSLEPLPDVDNHTLSASSKLKPNVERAASWSGPPKGRRQNAKAARSSSAFAGAGSCAINPCNTNALLASSAIFRLIFI